MLAHVWHNEPVRTSVYTGLLAVLVYLFVTGKVDANFKDVAEVVLGVLFVGGAAEAARTQVRPEKKEF